jgi:DNA repair protein RadC
MRHKATKEQAKTLALMLGLPVKYSLRAARVLELWEPEANRGAAIRRPLEVYNQVKSIHRAKKEYLLGLYLDAQNHLICKETISVGSLNTTRTHPREILYPAVSHLALGFILVHNHPSGSLDPSDEDITFTQSVKRASDLLGIELYDHVIVTRTGYTSLQERGAF